MSSRCRFTCGLPATVDRKIARAGKDGARLQAVESADRMAEMRGVGIADILRQMREVEILIGEMQEMPRALPGPEGSERNSSLLLEQMQKARGGQSGLRGAACRGHRLAGKPRHLRDRTHHARIEHAPRQ